MIDIYFTVPGTLLLFQLDSDSGQPFVLELLSICKDGQNGSSGHKPVTNKSSIILTTSLQERTEKLNINIHGEIHWYGYPLVPLVTDAGCGSPFYIDIPNRLSHVKYLVTTIQNPKEIEIIELNSRRLEKSRTIIQHKLNFDTIISSQSSTSFISPPECACLHLHPIPLSATLPPSSHPLSSLPDTITTLADPK